MRSLTTEAEGGGDSPLYYLTPATPPEKMLENMRVNIARGLPDVTAYRKHDLVMSIAGGGPSLADTYRDLEGWVCTINGSLQWVLDNVEGDHSIACGVCDAGEHIKDMVPAVPGVRYYVASVCDPGLFDKLIGAGCEVWLWHVSPNSTEDAEGVERLLSLEYDEWLAVGGGCTMGLRWLNLGYLLGFRKFRLHGMDSSFRDGETHAYNDIAKVKGEIEMGGRHTKVSYVAQVHDFAEMLEYMWDTDPMIDLKVFGDGLLQDEWRAFKEANPDAFTGDTFEQRMEAVMSRLPEGEIRGAEIGVFKGRMSRRLLKRPDLHLIMVDQWEPWATVGPDGHIATFPKEYYDELKVLAVAQTDFAAERRKIIHASSIEAAASTEDESLDFVFIDANHSYEYCREDIKVWLPKLKPGGLLCGHDYTKSFAGVMRAVNEFAAETKARVEIDVEGTWFTRKP